MFLIGCNDNEHEQFHFIDYYNPESVTKHLYNGRKPLIR